MMPSPALAIGPNDEILTIEDEEILDDDEDGPSSLDHEALHDDAC
jgi:hypothetical protein